MKRVVINALCVMIWMLIQSNFDSAFGVEIMVQFGIIGIILACGMAMPVVPATISVLVFGLFCDIWVSGPTGLYALLLSIVYVCVYLVMTRLRSDRVITMMVYAALSCIVFEAMLATAYGIIYRTWVFWSIFKSHFIWDALATAIFTPLLMFLVRALESLIGRRRTSGLS